MRKGCNILTFPIFFCFCEQLSEIGQQTKMTTLKHNYLTHSQTDGDDLATAAHLFFTEGFYSNKHFFEPTQIDSQNLGLADGSSKIIGRNQHIAFVRKLMEMTLLHTLKIYENFVQSFS